MGVVGVKQTEANGTAERQGKRVSVALPIRVIYQDGGLKPQVEMACTYDISAHGARISALRNLKEAGEIVTVERGRSKAMCRVAWIGKDGGRQIGLQCLDPDQNLWEMELRGLEEAYDPIETTSLTPRKSGFGQKPSKRRDPRYAVEGSVELLRPGDNEPLPADLENLSEYGCLLAAKCPLAPGMDVKLVLKVGSYKLAVKGRVRHSEPGSRLGIEFKEIRKGDRQALQYLLRKLGSAQKSGHAMTAVTH